MKLLKIGIAGVRGIVGETITPGLILNFACAFGTWLGEGPVLLGRDTRKSGPMLHHACRSALISTGCDVLDLGICPTPVLQYLVKEMGARGGISITAGHNSSEWNAITFINQDGTYLTPFQGDEVLDMFHLGQFTKMPVSSLGNARELQNYEKTYFDGLCRFVDVAAIKAAGFRIVVDCCNGSGAGIIDELGRCLGVEMVAVNNERSGYFPHDPEPLPRNAQQTSSVLKVLGAAAGFLTNSDVSRISLVTADGACLSEELTFPLIARSVLSRHPGPVIANLMTSRMIDDVASAFGSPVIRTRVGQSHVIEGMVIEDGVVAGEGSGGIAVASFQRAFDGFLIISLVLEAMATRGKSLGDLVAELPKYHIIKRQVACPLPRAYSLVDEVREHHKGEWIETQDGLRLDTGTGWIHLRVSATEPIVRIHVEDAAEDTANEQADEITHLISGLVR